VHTGLLFILTLVGALLEAIGVGAIPVFIGLLSSPGKLQQYPWLATLIARTGVSSQRDVVIWGGLGLFVLFTVKNLYGAGLIYLQSRFAYARFSSLSTQLFDGYLRAPYTFHLQRNSAELLRNTNQETTTLVQDVFVPTLLLLTEALVVGCVVVLLLTVEPLISLLAFGLLGGASVGFAAFVRRRAGELGRIQQQERRWLIQTVNEGLGGIKDAKVLGREAHFLEEYRRSVLEYSRTAQFNKLVGQLPRPFIETIAVAGLLLVGFVFVSQGRPVEAIVSTLALFGAAIVRLMPSAQRIMAAASCIRFSLPSLEVVTAELMNARKQRALGGVSPATSKASVGTDRLAVDRAIELRSVTYTYAGHEHPALRDVNISIAKNQMVGLVGTSGAGKSTLVDVLLGLLIPDSGRVLVDANDIHSPGKLVQWQRALGYIPQSIFLADATIRRNVAFGLRDEQVDDESIWEALQAAQLADFVRSLPDSLDTAIGERGVRISGGQRQRIGIARALYHRPSVLVMDEATSALDGRTEFDFIQAVERLRFGSTIVLVAHRMTTVRNCDLLYLLEGGRVVDSGTYDSLQLTSAKFRDVASIT
jgi:ATP-binding cassette subfamily C protein